MEVGLGHDVFERVGQHLFIELTAVAELRLVEVSKLPETSFQQVERDFKILFLNHSSVLQVAEMADQWDSCLLKTIENLVSFGG